MNEKPTENKDENWHMISEIMISKNEKPLDFIREAVKDAPIFYNKTLSGDLFLKYRDKHGNEFGTLLKIDESRRIYLQLKSALAGQPTELGARTEAEMNLAMVETAIEQTDEDQKRDIERLWQVWNDASRIIRKPSRDLFIRLLHAQLMVEKEKSK